MDRKIFSTMGVSEHIREKDDFYATPPEAVEQLLQRESFNKLVWEPCVGMGHMARVLQKHDYIVLSSDIVNRNYPNTNIFNFVEPQQNPILVFDDNCIKDLKTIQDLYISGNINTFPDIVTNPPYKYGAEFVQRALEISPYGTKIAMFLKIQFLESKKRFELIYQNNPPAKVYVFVNRVACWEGGIPPTASSAICYAWYIWIKGFQGQPVIDWIY